MSTALFRKMIQGRLPVNLLIAVVLMVLAALLTYGVKPLQARYFPVRFVRIQGAFAHLDRSTLEQAVGPQLEAGYWGLDLEKIRSAAENLAWVRSVRIQRRWPDTLILRVREHVPYARFGEDRLLSEEGVVFWVGAVEPFTGLPVVEGPADRGVEIRVAFEQLHAKVQELGMRLEKLSISERNSWSAQLSGGVVVELGRDAPVRTFERFVAAVSLLGDQQVQSMIRADLRYRNGFAVEWKPGNEPEWGSFVKGNDPGLRDAAQSI